MSDDDQLIRTVEDIDGAWLGSVLSAEGGVTVEAVTPIGTGQMSGSFRVAYSGGDGDAESGTVVVKLASEDANSRAAGVGFGAYLREISFYRNLAERIGAPLVPHHLAVYDPSDGWFTLVMEDVTGAVQGDQIAGCSPAQAHTAMIALARIHAPVFNDLTLAATGWLNGDNPLNQALLTQLLPAFFERYGDRIEPAHREVCERFVASSDAWSADRRAPLGLVHGDYRLDNLLFHDEGCSVVDWQTVGWGPAMLDCSYFLAGGLSTEDRREHEESLVRVYYDELLAQGVRGFGWATCWEEYRRQCFLGIVMAIAPAMLVERTPRGDDMFMAVLGRTAQMAIDHGSLDLLPDPELSAPQPLRPEPEDEGRHEPGTEPLWNESWYFDSISADGSIGVYHRLGRLPNSDACLLSTCIVRPGEPAIMLVDAAAPLPAADDDSQAISTERVRTSFECKSPLERFRVRVEGTAAAHADHSAPLRGEDGEPVEIELDLTWETDGAPYQWRLATRYEIPCRVSGTVRIGTETIELSGPGQRDHSWGSRDWWSSDWMWSALHLDDGTRTHAVAVPEMPGFGVGYVQRDGALTELTGVASTEEVGADGLITSARIVMTPGDVAVNVEPLAFGAILLEAPDGRVSHFPRAMCRLSADDGRTGYGWVEWNRNQR